MGISHGYIFLLDLISDFDFVLGYTLQVRAMLGPEWLL